MKRMDGMVVMLGLVVSSAVCGAQAPAAGPMGPAAEVQAAYARIKPNVLKAAEKMPEADFQYKPTADIRAFARIVNHVTEAQFHVCSALNGTPMDPKAVPSDTADKATVIAGLKASFEACDKAYACADRCDDYGDGDDGAGQADAHWSGVGECVA